MVRTIGQSNIMGILQRRSATHSRGTPLLLKLLDGGQELDSKALFAQLMRLLSLQQIGQRKAVASMVGTGEGYRNDCGLCAAAISALKRRSEKSKERDVIAFLVESARKIGVAFTAEEIQEVCAQRHWQLYVNRKPVDYSDRGAILMMQPVVFPEPGVIIHFANGTQVFVQRNEFSIQL